MQRFLIFASLMSLAACDDVKRDGGDAAKETAVREQRVTLGMTPEQVTASRGNPIVREPQANGTEVWGYRDGTLVTFSKGKVIDSRKHDLPPAKPGAAVTPVKTVPSRTATYVPGLTRYVEHDSAVSPMRSIGGGGGDRAEATHPTATMLDRSVYRDGR